MEKSDRAFISQLVLHHHPGLLILVCLLFVHHFRKLKHLQAYFMALPTPVLSDGDIVEVQSTPPVLSDSDIVEVQSTPFTSAKLFWNAWSQDPIKDAILRAILSRQSRIVWYPGTFCRTVSVALGHNRVRPLHYSLLKEEGVHYLNVFRIPKRLLMSSLPWIHILASGIETRRKNREDLSPLASCGPYTYKPNA